jgi:hypothetical protein
VIGGKYDLMAIIERTTLSLMSAVAALVFAQPLRCEEVNMAPLPGGNALMDTSSSSDVTIDPSATPSTGNHPAPERPALPPPADVSLPPPLGNGVPKRPLAWRAKAYAMTRAQTSPQKPERLINADPEEIFFAIIATCPQFNIRVESANSAAGQLMARFAADPNAVSPRIIIVVKPAGSQKASLSASVEPENSSVRSAVDALLSNVSSGLSRKGSL